MEVVIAAVQRNRHALRSAPEKMKNVKEVVMAAVQKDGSYGLRYAAEDMKNDKEVVMAAVQQNGHALQYAPEDMKQDKEVVMAAVQQNGMALEYAPEDMKKDKEVVMAAVQQNASALKNAPEDMRKELVEEARSFDITVQELCAVAAYPKIIQLFLSEGSDSGGYDGASLTISCRDLEGKEVLALPLRDESDNLRNELAKTMGVSTAALQLINHRGEKMRDCREMGLKDFLAVGK